MSTRSQGLCTATTSKNQSGALLTWTQSTLANNILQQTSFRNDDEYDDEGTHEILLSVGTFCRENLKIINIDKCYAASNSGDAITLENRRGHQLVRFALNCDMQ